MLLCRRMSRAPLGVRTPDATVFIQTYWIQGQHHGRLAFPASVFPVSFVSAASLSVYFILASHFTVYILFWPPLRMFIRFCQFTFLSVSFWQSHLPVYSVLAVFISLSLSFWSSLYPSSQLYSLLCPLLCSTRPCTSLFHIFAPLLIYILFSPSLFSVCSVLTVVPPFRFFISFFGSTSVPIYSFSFQPLCLSVCLFCFGPTSVRLLLSCPATLLVYFVLVSPLNLSMN